MDRRERLIGARVLRVGREAEGMERRREGAARDMA
jgi:hypothetical protein